MIQFETGYTAYSDLSDIHPFDINVALAADDNRIEGYPRLFPDRVSFSGDSAGFTDDAVKIMSALNPDVLPVTADSLLIVGGQQVGLMGGPMYTFLKAVTSIRLARQLSEQWNRDIRPAFWCATEDHDVLEVNRFNISGKTYVNPPPFQLERGRMPPVGTIDIHESREPVIAFLTESLMETEFTPRLLDLINTIDFSTYGTQFKHLMRILFNSYGLLLIDPLSIQHLIAPCLATVVERWPDCVDALSEGSRILKDSGFSVPLPRLRIFEMHEGRRIPLDITSRGTRLITGSVSLEELAGTIREYPERFSPGAALRALCQDSAFPVVATIGGPAELLYLWQIMPLYSILGIRHSARFPRISATFLSPSVVRTARKMNLDWRVVFDILDMADAASPEEDDRETRTVVDRGAALLDAIDALHRPDDPRWLRTGRKTIASGIERIVSQLREERRTRYGLSRNRMEKIMHSILPDGKMQEREVNVVQFLNSYGFDFVTAAVDSLDPWKDGHHIVRVVPVPGKE